jgi:ribonuclease HI
VGGSGKGSLGGGEASGYLFFIEGSCAGTGGGGGAGIRLAEEESRDCEMGLDLGVKKIGEAGDRECEVMVESGMGV